MALSRMQQRRGPSADWLDANTILASGEIGYETDTKKFKIGDGVTAWPSLPYFENEVDVAAAIQAAVDGILDLPPETLDTLNELAAALGDDPDFFNTVVYKAGSTMSGPLILSADPTQDLEAATKQYVDSLETMEPGGTTGQALTKTSNDDYDVQWTTVAFDLNGLNDVDTSGAVDKNTLVYEEDTNSWVAGPGGGRFTVSETAPTDVLNGDTWLDSTTGNSYLYYEDYDNPQWIQIAGPGTVGTRGATLFIGTVAPINPVEGDLWYDSEEGFTYLYYVDSDSSQWIQFGLNRNGASGVDGTNGTNGTDGTDGADGIGIPSGGDQGQVLSKSSGTDYDVSWTTPSAAPLVEPGLLLIASGSVAPSNNNYYINNIFSTDYDYYKVIIKFPDGTGQGTGSMQFTNAAGTDVYPNNLYFTEFVSATGGNTPSPTYSSATTSANMFTEKQNYATSELFITYPAQASEVSTVTANLTHAGNFLIGRRITYNSVVAGEYFGLSISTLTTNNLEYAVYAYNK